MHRLIAYLVDEIGGWQVRVRVRVRVGVKVRVRVRDRVRVRVRVRVRFFARAITPRKMSARALGSTTAMLPASEVKQRVRLP